MKFLSVSEYASLYGKDVGNIRRMLASGRISGQKVGKQWIIPEDCPYPEDKRITTGEYRNWRNKVALNHNKEFMKTINEMVSSLRKIYGKNLLQVVLYGSYARGTQTEDSDVDIAIFVRRKPSKKVGDAMIDCVANYELECGKTLSVIDINSEKYNNWKDVMPFYKNIQKEGIVLWKEAA